MTRRQLEVPGTPTMTACGAEDGLAPRGFEFREVTEVGEVENALALRHRVYGQTEAVRGFLDPEGPALLLDSYDRFARLFGLFVCTQGASRLIGTMRVVTMDPGPASLALEMIAAPHPRLIRRLRTPRRVPLPFLEQCADHGRIAARVTRAMARGESIVEAGRFAIDTEFRAERGTRFRLAREMIEATMAQFFVPNACERAFITCVHGHIAFYARVGFRVVPVAGPILAPATGSRLVCLEITRDAVAGEVRSRVLARAVELTATGRIVLATATGGSGRPGFCRDTTPLPPPFIRRIAPSAIAHPALRVSTAC